MTETTRIEPTGPGAPAAPKTIDLDAAAAFIEALAGSPDALMTFQTFDDVEAWGEKKDKSSGELVPAWVRREDRSLIRELHGTLSGCAPELAALNARGAGVYYCVNVTDGRGRTAANIVDLRALYVDKDNGTLPDALPLVSIRVLSSPGKEQALWRLASGEPRQDFQRAQKQLIANLDTDTAVHDLPRVLRLPGFFHNKGLLDPARGPHLVEAWYGELTPRTIPEVLKAYPPLRLVRPGEAPRRPRKTRRDRWDEEVSGLALARANRNNILFRVARLGRDLLRVGEISEPEVRGALNEACERNGLAEEEGDKTQNAIDRALAEDESLLQFLTKDAQGVPKNSLGNIIRILAEADGWKGVLGFNERTRRPEILREPPWDSGIEGYDRTLPRLVTDEDGGRLAAWLQRHQMNVSLGMAMQGLAVLAQQNPFDRVRDYLEALPPWDGVRRCRYWLQWLAGAQEGPYVEAVSKRWLISAVARVFEPGCQADDMLVLEGVQGEGKSSLLRALASKAFFFDTKLILDQKDALMQIHGPWIGELADLASVRSAADVETVKQFLSVREDQFRSPFGRFVQTWPRRIVFAGSTNRAQYLTDETGGRRFLCVRCRASAIDIARAEEMRDQLWAEALYRYRYPEQWHLTDEEKDLAVVEVEKRYEHDAIEDQIAIALVNGVKRNSLGLGVPGQGVWGISPNATSVSTLEILEFVCRDTEKRDIAMQHRVARALRRLGWEQGRGPDNRGPRRWYRLPASK